jgi:hypothetical protein
MDPLTSVQESFKSSSNTSKMLVALVVVLVLYVIYRCFFSNEHFESKKIKTSTVDNRDQLMNEARQAVAGPTELVETDREIVINPPYKNADTRTIMAGSGFIPQKDVIPAWGSNYGLTDDLDDGEGGNMGFHYNLCSPSCCSAQYPTPHKLKKDPLLCGREDEFASTNYFCSNAWQNSGCLCAKKNQVGFLTNRGGNAE